MGPVESFKMHKRISSGFTLIELVVVLAVLTILVSAAIAALQNITQKAQIAQIKATLKSVRSAILIQKAKNELDKDDYDNPLDCGGADTHPRVNFWPTYEEVRRSSYQDQLSSSILDLVLPGNPFIDPAARTPPFDNTFKKDCSGNIFYPNPDVGGASKLSNNLVVCAPQYTPKGTRCPASDCSAGWVYNPYTGEFWANSSEQFAEQRSW